MIVCINNTADKILWLEALKRLQSQESGAERFDIILRGEAC